MIHEVLTIQTPGESEAGRLYTYFWSPSRELDYGNKRPVILLCPGGAYERTSDVEAEGIALRFMSMGYHTAVLRYSCGKGIHYPTALLQLAASVALLRERADEWGILKDQIIVQGSSAGGHLAACLAVFWKKDRELAGRLGKTSEDIRPNGLMLSYPVITSGEFAHKGSFHNLLGDRYEEMKDRMSLEKQVSSDVPLVFLWHTLADGTVPAENSLLFLGALRKAGVPAEFHLFPEGKHGLGLADRMTSKNGSVEKPLACSVWPELGQTWLDHFFPWYGAGKSNQV